MSAVFGLAMFLFLLLAASQTLLHLYATSVVTSVAFDTARQVSAHGLDCGPDGQTADGIARARLGAYGEDASVQVRCRQVGGFTTVTVQARTPARALATTGYGLGLSDIQRTASVRSEGPAGADAAGPGGAGPDAAGPDAAGPGGAGLDAVGPGGAGSGDGTRTGTPGSVGGGP